MIKINTKIAKISFAISNLVSLAMAGTIFAIKVLYTKKTNLALIRLNRYLIIFIATLAIFVFLLLFLDYLRKNKILEVLSFIFLNILLIVLVSYIYPQVFQYTREFVYFGESAFGTQSLLRLIGFSLGIVLCYLIYMTSLKIMIFLDEKKFNLVSIVFFFIYAIYYCLKAVISLQRLKIVPLNDIVFGIMIITDKHYKLFIYALCIVMIFLAVCIILNSRQVIGNFKNKALKRKAIAKNRNKRRWSYTLIVSCSLSIFTLSVVHYYDTKEVQLAEPSPYETRDNLIFLDTALLEDGHLHRYEFETPNGYNVKFLAVKKPIGGAYGVGLDACEICGVAGYFERDDEVVCKRCDVVMNKATIGFKGGCNPIPFPYEVKDGMIVIDKQELIREEKRFK